MSGLPLAGYGVLELAHLIAGPACGMYLAGHPRAGRFRRLDTAIRLSETPGGIRTPAPTLAEHTDLVLAEAGLTPSEIGKLREVGVIA